MLWMAESKTTYILFRDGETVKAPNTDNENNSQMIKKLQITWQCLLFE